jgi:hypothetical protein
MTAVADECTILNLNVHIRRRFGLVFHPNKTSITMLLHAVYFSGSGTRESS